MKKIFLLFLIVFTTIAAGAQTEKYSKVKIYTDAQGMNRLSSLGLAVDEGIYAKDRFFISDFSESELALIRANGFNTEILVDDVIAEYLKKNKELEGQPLAGDPVLSRDYPVPYEFQLGSMGGFCTWEQFIGHLDYMYNTYPALITQKVAIGTTLENRPVYMVKLTGTAQRKDPKPQVLYTGMHHAREPIGMMHLLFYMYYLLENYSTDPEIKNLVDNTEMYFIPVLNPDGYKYNQTTNPSGGGMWRKNRRPNGGGSYGVDLNRNYGFMWGGDGSSGYPDDETYRGPSPFSELETQAIKSFCESHEFALALNYHSVAALLLSPWGYTSTPPPDNPLFLMQEALMTAENGYTYGPANTTIYVVSGSSDDWMYGDNTMKPKIFAYTPEVGGSGFWPTVNEIIPLCQENMLQSLLAAKFAGNYGHLRDESPSIFSQTDGYLKFSVSQVGRDSISSFSVSITPLGTGFLNIGDSVILGGIIPGNTVLDSIPFTLDPLIQNGTLLTYVINLNDGSFIRRDTIHKIYGQATIAFNDACNNTNNWTPGGWGVTTNSYHSAPSSITDSPNGNYQNNANKSITQITAVDLTTASYAVLNFWTKWDLEAGYDYVQVKISINGGSTWIPLEGNYTHPGNNNQAPGEPLYDGTQTFWVQESMDLSAFLGHSVKLRFTLVSDGSVTGDGFYFDDVTLTIITAPTGYSIGGLISYPNVSNTPLGGIVLNLKNGSGTTIATTTTNASGIYSFSGIGNGSYSIEAATTKPWGGVTAADVLLYKKHIAGISTLSGIFLASGDVNGSGTLTAGDVLLIRKRIATIISSFPTGDWLFNASDVTVNGGNVVQNFNGITFGDANGSYIPGSLKSSRPVLTEGELVVGPARITEGSIGVPIFASEIQNMGSFQFSIGYDAGTLEFKGISGILQGLESLMASSPEPGILTFVWAADLQGLGIAGGELFTMEFVSKTGETLLPVFADGPTVPEFGDYDGNLFTPVLKSGIENCHSAAGQRENEEFYVYPNPGHGAFTLHTTLNTSDTYILKVSDLTGKNVFHEKAINLSSAMSHSIDLEHLPKGIYILSIESNRLTTAIRIVVL